MAITRLICYLLQVMVVMMMFPMVFNGLVNANHDYADALMKSILFFEGQRSGKLPSTQRLTWRKDSALQDGHDMGVSNSILFNMIHVLYLYIYI